MKNEVKSQMMGRAAEYLVAAKLLMNGCQISWPATDEGYDLTGPNGCRIQVKSTRLSTRGSLADTYPDGVYVFGFGTRSHFSPTKKRRTILSKFSDRCDVVVLVGLDQNKFWVAPASVIDGSYGLYLGVTSERAFEKDIPAMREMEKLGYTQTEIGKHFGITGSAVCTRLKRAGDPLHQDTVSFKVRQLENNWDLILNFNQVSTVERSTLKETI